MESLDGDYERRHTGLLALMRPRDVFLYDRWRSEFIAGVVGLVPPSLAVGHAILSVRDGRSWTPVPADWGPLLYLYSTLQHGGSVPSCPLIETAYAEVKHERVLSKVFREANPGLRVKARSGDNEG